MIELNRAVYCYDRDSGKAATTSWPVGHNNYRGWSTAGAVYTRYGKLTKIEKRFNLLIEAWQSVVREGIDPLSAHRALLKVEGMSELFAEDCQEVPDGA